MATRVEAEDDPSNGYESIASEFMQRREQSGSGLATFVDGRARPVLTGAGLTLVDEYRDEGDTH